MNNVKKLLGSAAVASFMMIVPFAASADSLNAHTSTGIVINPSGIVRVIGADVTAVGNGFVNAVAHIGNVLVSLVINTSADTKIAANGSKSATTTDIKVGDKVAFKGTLTSSTGSALTIAATKVRDFTNFPLPRIMLGVIGSLNTTSGTFTVVNGSTTTTVATNASTTITFNGDKVALSALPVNSKVAVVGTTQTNGTVLATKVIARTAVTTSNDDHKGDKHDNDDNSKKGDHKDSKSDHGLHLGSFLGLHIGKNK